MRYLMRRLLVGSIFGIIVLVALPLTTSAANLVSWQMVKQGTTDPVDTIYVGGKYQFQILIENDVRLGGMTLLLKIHSPDGIIWDYSDSVVSVISGSRMDGAWDMTGILWYVAGPWGNGNLGPPGDTFSVGGVAILVGMDTGPAEPMFGINFTPLNSEAWTNGFLGTICIDEGPPFDTPEPSQFVTEQGYAFIADFVEGRCWPVVMICGNPNGDDDINVGDPVFLINHIFRGGPGPNPFLLGDANLDGDVNVGDVIFLIQSSFLSGPRPGCPVDIQ